MAHSEKAFLVSALALAGLIGCGGSDQNTQPQTPASQTDTTMTTGARAPGSTEPTPSQGQYGAANPSTYGQGSATNTTGNPSANPSGTGGTGQTWSGSPSTGSGSAMGAGSVGSNAGGTGSSVGSDSSANAITDDQIAAITNAANGGEVDQAKEVLKKTKNGKIRTFAQHMIADHGAAFKEQTEIERKYSITPKDNETSRTIQSDGKTVLSTIQSASAADVDRQYIDAQVKEHQTVLDALDNKLIPNAKNGDLKAFLQKIRGKVANHLKDAQDIQSSLK